MTLLRKTFAALGLCAPLLAFSAPTATSLDPLFAVTADPNVYDAATVEHVTLQGALSGGNDVAWYSFTAKAGQRFYADHDDAIGGGGTLIDSMLSLFDASGRLLAAADDSDLDPGSNSSSNAFLGVYTLPTTGLYYLALSAWGNGADVVSCTPAAVLAVPQTGGIGGTGYDACGTNFTLLNAGAGDGSFTLNVSLTAVPEPGSLALAGVALAGLAWTRRRQATAK